MCGKTKNRKFEKEAVSVYICTRRPTTAITFLFFPRHYTHNTSSTIFLRQFSQRFIHKMSVSESSRPTSASNDGSTTSRSTSSTSNSSAESSEVAEIDAVQVKLRQMRRHNKGKGVPSKLSERFKSMMTPEQRAKNELNKRIDKGLRDVLQLHTPIELSSICGILGLTPLERASVSIDMILQFCKEEGDFSEVKVIKAVNNMWEGALFEYLKSIGQGFNTCLPDPKLAVMKIWRRGGFHENDQNTFTPHYIQRRVLTRHDSELAEDIASRAAKLKVVENSLKHVERELFEEHDYTNALMFFQKIGDVRRLETEFRDYLINKLELARSELSRADSNQQLAADMLAEGESRYVSGLEMFNEQLAHYEISSQHDMQARCRMDLELTSLCKTVESYAAEHSSQSQHIRAAANEDKHDAYIDYENCHLREMPYIERYNKHIRRIYNSLMQYRGMVEVDSAAALKTISMQQNEIFRLQKTIEDLNVTVRDEKKRGDDALDALESAHKEIRFCAKKMVSMKVEAEAVRREAWKTTIRWSGRCDFLERKIGQLKTIVRTGIQTQDKLVVSMCRAINSVLAMVPEESLQELYELAAMEIEDQLSEEVRQEEIRLAAIVVPKGKVKKGAKKTPSKKGKGSGDAKKSSSGAKKSSGGAKKPAAAGKKKPPAKKPSASKKKK